MTVTTLLVAFGVSLIAAIVHDAMPKLALQMGRIASRLTPPYFQKTVDPYADIFEAVQGIGAGGETEFSTFRMAVGALFITVPRLLFLRIVVTIQVAIVYRRAWRALKKPNNGLDGQKLERLRPSQRAGSSSSDTRDRARRDDLFADAISNALDMLMAKYPRPAGWEDVFDQCRATNVKLLALVRSAFELDGLDADDELMALAVETLHGGGSARTIRLVTGLSQKQSRWLKSQSLPFCPVRSIEGLSGWQRRRDLPTRLIRAQWVIDLIDHQHEQ
jgi:hypothetical protein